jgi:hypothetical protein
MCPNGALTGNPDVPRGAGSTTTTWSNLSIDKPGTYTLIAIFKTTSGSAWGVTSAAFNITP